MKDFAVYFFINGKFVLFLFFKVQSSKINGTVNFSLSCERFKVQINGYISLSVCVVQNENKLKQAKMENLVVTGISISDLN